ncbi:phage major capsid protein [Synechococcus sp. EJ6-Ellesmere]|uniref:phage major capsid protein n=1 Tax=Synechococcus sp. EJ6-Ellesmere TaxID=2823734 RepID=UPI0020CD6EFB|nr:phage major capsid protein [Synechococcus sp. EJ6-Ellesmere]MCP9824500.1 phage major capsid protein [Synechococcus sp. EJ6-Ellesmere]
MAALVRSQLRDPELRVTPGEGSRELKVAEQLAAANPSVRKSGALMLPPRAAVVPTALATDGVMLAEILRPETALTRLGARRLELPIGWGGSRSVSPSRVTAGWTNYMLAETEETREIQFGSSNVTPRECSITTEVTRRFLADAVSAEEMLQAVMRSAMESEQERVQIVGSGSGTQPLGILRAAQAGAIATSSGPLTYASLTAALQGRLDAGARLSRCGFLLPQADFDDLAALERTGGHPALVERPDGGHTLAGRPVEFSEWLPSGHAVAGEFSQCALVFMGAEQLLVNPYSRIQQQITTISLYSTFDACIDRPSLLAVVMP